MGLRMENFDIMGVHWKIQFLEGCMKNNILGVNCLKGESWIVCRFKRALGKKEILKFLRWGWDPNAHYELEEPCWHKYPNQITL